VLKCLKKYFTVYLERVKVFKKTLYIMPWDMPHWRRLK